MRLQGLVLVGADGDRGDIDVAVGHRHAPQVLLGGALSGRGELGDGAELGRLGALAAGVGVELGIHHQDVHVLAHGKHVVQAAEADVVGPAVAAVDPDRLLGEEVGRGGDLLQERVVVPACGRSAFSRSPWRRDCSGSFIPSSQPASASLARPETLAGQRLAHLVRQRVRGAGRWPCGSRSRTRRRPRRGSCSRPGRAPRVGAVGADRGRGAPDRGAAGGVGDHHPLAEELGDQPCVGRLAAARSRRRRTPGAAAGTGSLSACSRFTRCPLARSGLGELAVFLLDLGLGLDRLHHQRRLLSRADVGAVAAPHAVQRIDLDPEADAP